MNKLKLFLSAVLMMCCTMRANADLIIDDSGYCQLSVKDDLILFADYVNGQNGQNPHPDANAILMADITVNESVLDSNGDLASSTFETWTPIDGGGSGYKGEFNGNGHTISGLYIKDTSKDKIGLFGVMVKGAYIHDLGVKDSYFSGNNWVAGFCGDFGGGRIENCWNAATVISNSNNSDGCCAGGIAASCWTDASVKGCYNIGKVTAQHDIQCGGICGVVNSTVSDCVTLDVCNVVCKDLRSNAQIINVAIKDINAFKSGEVCWILNNGVTDKSQKWYQTLGEGKDVYPMLDNTRGIVYALGKNCDGSGKGYSNTDPGEITQDSHTTEYHPYKAPTDTEEGNIEYWHCSVCDHNFADSDCTKLITGSVIILNIKGSWTILEQPTCSTYGTMQNPANTSELRLVPKVAHLFGDDGKCTVCGHPAPTEYNGTPATSLVTITESNYAAYGLTEKNKSCVMGWTVITTAEEFMKYINANGMFIGINAFLAEDIILDYTKSLPDRYINPGYVFDGTGHTISNVQRNGDYIVGLFGKNDGIIRNLGLISPKIEISGSLGGCICGNNCGTIENCFVIDGNIDGQSSQNYGIANQANGKIINCYAISNKGNIGYAGYDCTVTNSYAATTSSVPDDFYSKTLSGLNNNKSNGMSWYHSSASYPVMMPSMIHHSAQSATCTEGGLADDCWQCTVCGKYFSDATHSQEILLIVPALGHNMELFAEIPATCTEKGIKEHYHCDQCEKNFDDANGTNEINDLGIPINPDNHPSLSMVNGKAHCDQCKQDFENFVATDNNPVLLNSENDSYSLDKLELKYGHSYFCTDDFKATNSSYKFYVNPGKWNSWFVPFAVTTGSLEANDLTAAYIAGIRQYEKDAEGNITTQVDIIKIKNARLRAGTPYLVKYDGEDLGDGNILTLVLGETDFAASSDVHLGHTETMTASYDFIGCYEKAEFDISDKDMYYFIGSNGSLVHSKSNSFSALDWYLKVTPKGDVYDDLSTPSLAKSIIINVIGEEDETTGIRTLYPAEKQVKEVYDLSGRRLNAPKKGQINIINGKKILVK